MDYAPLVLAAIGIIVIMQIITIVMITRLRLPEGKKKFELQPIAPQVNKDDRSRPARRPEHKSPAPSAAPKAIPQGAVDRSLREINLRLRNAERDQARARMTSDQAGNTLGDLPRDRDRNRGRNNGPRRDNRDSRDSRDRSDWKSREPRRDDNRPGQARPVAENRAPVKIEPVLAPQPAPTPQFTPEPQFAPAPQIAPEPQFTLKPQAEPAPVVAVEPLPQAPVSIQQPAFDLQANTEHMEHGRKVTVKRRVLKADEEGGPESQTVSEQASGTASQPSDQSAPAAQPQALSREDISFGRR